jgi:hypothetical protein
MMTCSLVWAQRTPDSRGTFFTGGSYDGTDATTLTYRLPEETAAPFIGGDYDGVDMKAYQPNQPSSTGTRYTGGSYDGAEGTSTTYHLPGSTEALFTGGSYDGAGSESDLPRAAAKTGTFFTGGNYDGTGSDDFAYRQATSTEAPFTGGSYDGATMSVTANDISLPVQLALFTAVPHYDGIEVVIETASETNFAGFNIFRSDSLSGTFVLIASYLNHPDLRGKGNDTHGHRYSYKDTHIQSGMLYWYKLVSVDVDGRMEAFGPVSARGWQIPGTFELKQNYPNPFNPSTTIVFSLPLTEQGVHRVRLEIFDVNGKKVRTLIQGELHPGTYRVTWDRLTDTGQRATSGVYFYRLVTQEFVQSHRMVLLK